MGTSAPSHRNPPDVTGKPHTIKRNPTRSRPESLLFLDTETKVVSDDGEIQYHKFRLGWTCFLRRRPGHRKDTEVWREHRNPESMCREIAQRTREKSTLYVFASNPSFDLWVTRFYETFAKWGWKASFVYNKGVYFILVCRKSKRKIAVLALQNYFFVGVKGVGELLNLPKIDANPLTATEDELWGYCRRDVEIVRGGVLTYLDFLTENDCGAFGYTLSGQAFNFYRHRYMKHPLWVHRNPEVLALERYAYYGGRTEAFKLGRFTDGPYVTLDVTSLYPYVMRHYLYPAGLQVVFIDPSDRQVEHAIKQGCVVADVTLETDNPWWAFRLDGRTCFPVGEFRTGVCTFGLLAAMETGALRKVHAIAGYRARPIFREYVDSVFALRQRFKEQGNEAFQQVCKYLLNKLYGKFGQANSVTVSREETDDTGFCRYMYIPQDGSGAMMVTQIMHSILTEQGTHEHRDSMPAVAAHVTEYGRFHLAELIDTVGRDRVFYCDTDSLLIHQRDMDRLSDYLDGKRLGSLKVEGCTDTLELFGPKDYAKDGRRTLKGIPERAREVTKGTFEYEMFPGLNSLLTGPKGTQIPNGQIGMFEPREIIDLQGRGLYPVHHVSKTLERKYLKGTVCLDGNIQPYCLNGRTETL